MYEHRQYMYVCIYTYIYIYIYIYIYSFKFVLLLMSNLCVWNLTIDHVLLLLYSYYLCTNKLAKYVRMCDRIPGYKKTASPRPLSDQNKELTN